MNATLPTARTWTTSVDAKGVFFVLGGYDGQKALDQVVQYRPDTDTILTPAPNLPAARLAGNVVWTGQAAYYLAGLTTPCGCMGTPSIIRWSPDSLTRPTPPLNLQASPGPRPGTIQLSWQAPANDGNTPIIQYGIYRTTAEGTVLVGTTAAVLSYTDAWFPDSSWISTGKYQYFVIAVNAIGSSDSSLAASRDPLRALLPIIGACD